MSFIKLPLNEVEASVTRPLIFAVVRQIMERSNIPLETRIIYKDQSESVLQPNSQVGAKANGQPQLSGNSQLYIEVAEQPDINLITTQDGVQDNTHPPLFLDDALGIVVLPVKKDMEVTVTVRFRCNSKTFAERWRNDIWFNVSNQRDLDLHTVDYAYMFPLEYIQFLRYFHGLREKVAGYGDTFDQYFVDHCDNSLTGVSNLSGSTALVHKPETQTRILGWYDFQGEPERAQKEGESSTWTTEFSYKFRYEKPTHTVLRFPVAIHNQLVDERMFGKMQKMLHEKQLQYSKITQNNRHFETDYLLTRAMSRKPNQRRIPAHDDIAYSQYVPNTFTMFSSIIELSPDTNVLFNLNDLGDFGLDPDILNYIADLGYPWITKPWADMLNLSLYRNEHLTDPNNLQILPNLDVIARAGTDIRKINRVRLSYHGNVTDVVLDALERWKKHPDALRKIISVGDTKPSDIYKLKPRVDLTDYLPDLQIKPTPGQEKFFDENTVPLRNTVLSSHIRAHRKGS